MAAYYLVGVGVVLGVLAASPALMTSADKATLTGKVSPWRAVYELFFWGPIIWPAVLTEISRLARR